MARLREERNLNRSSASSPSPSLASVAVDATLQVSMPGSETQINNEIITQGNHHISENETTYYDTHQYNLCEPSGDYENMLKNEQKVTTNNCNYK